MPQVRCPNCSTVVNVAAGQKPVCPSCGFGGGHQATLPSSPPAPTRFDAPPLEYLTAPAARRPGWVTASSVIGIILSGLIAAFGLAVAILGNLLADAFADAGYRTFAGLGAALFVLIGIVALLFGGVYIMAGIFSLKGRNWARIVLIVLAALGLVNTVTTLQDDAIVQLALDVLIIVGLVLPASNAWFRAMSGRSAYT